MLLVLRSIVFGKMAITSRLAAALFLLALCLALTTVARPQDNSNTTNNTNGTGDLTGLFFQYGGGGSVTTGGCTTCTTTTPKPPCSTCNNCRTDPLYVYLMKPPRRHGCRSSCGCSHQSCSNCPKTGASSCGCS